MENQIQEHGRYKGYTFQYIFEEKAQYCNKIGYYDNPKLEKLKNYIHERRMEEIEDKKGIPEHFKDLVKIVSK